MFFQLKFFSSLEAKHVPKPEIGSEEISGDKRAL